MLEENSQGMNVFDSNKKSSSEKLIGEAKESNQTKNFLLQYSI